MSDGLKPYPAYKDSDVEWLGQVPAHWEVRRVKSSVSHIVKQTNAMEPNDLYIALEHVESWTGRLRKVNDDTEFDSQVKRFRAQDVLFGKLRPYLAKVVRPAQGGVCVGEFLVLRCKDAVSPAFLEVALRSAPAIDLVNSSTYGAKMPRADWPFVGDMPFPFPPLPEQNAIVRFLDYMDRRIRRVIRARQRRIKLLEEYKQALIHRAVTGQIDVRTGQPYPAYKPSGVEWLGQVPEHWEVRRLGSLLQERRETNEGLRVTEVLSVLRERGVIPYAEKGNIGNKKSDDISRYKVVRPNDIVVNSMNVIIGSVGLSKFTGCISPVYYILTRRDAQDDPGYLNAYFQTKPFQQSLIRLGNGILAHRMRIPMELLKCEPFPRPPADEQTAIVRFLDTQTTKIDAAIAATRSEIELLREYRTRLIADVVTGKVDVREVAARLPEEPPEEAECMDADEIAEGEATDEEAGAETVEEEEVEPCGLPTRAKPGLRA